MLFGLLNRPTLVAVRDLLVRVPLEAPEWDHSVARRHPALPQELDHQACGGLHGQRHTLLLGSSSSFSEVKPFILSVSWPGFSRARCSIKIWRSSGAVQLACTNAPAPTPRAPGAPEEAALSSCCMAKAGWASELAVGATFRSFARLSFAKRLRPIQEKCSRND